jgi:hypothetical protein
VSYRCPGARGGEGWFTNTKIPSCDLPDDLFGPGEVKPSRPQKKKNNNGMTKKRSATDVRRMDIVPLAEHRVHIEPQSVLSDDFYIASIVNSADYD